MSVRLLVPFDGFAASLQAVELLAGYAGDNRKLAPLVLNVQPRVPDTGRTVLKPAVERLAAAGFAASAEVRLGPPAPTILAEARRFSAQAIVMGTRGSGLAQGFALGSVALRVVQGDGPPVWLVKPEDRLPGSLGVRLRVLLAMDGSPPALRAAERLVAWRDWLGELEVHLAWVQQPLSYLETVLPPHDDVTEQWSTREGEQAAEAAREMFRAEGIKHHLHFSVGDPALEMRSLASQASADLVVLGTRGLGAAHHAFIGSVALKTAVLCPVPVVLVP